MPITASAKKKLLQDKKRNSANEKVKNQVKKAIHNVRINPKAKNVQTAYSLVDIAAKKRIIHKNKAARLKSKIAKWVVTTNKSEIKIPKRNSKKS